MSQSLSPPGQRLRGVAVRGTIEHVFLQGSLLASGEVRIDPTVPIERVELDDSSWLDVADRWLTGADDLFAELVDVLAWSQRRGVPMYDRMVDEPRLT